MISKINYLEYNTQQRRLPLPEYGRSVQNMVDYAMTIEDRAERQRCANTIVAIMGGMFPHLRDVPDFKHKLWDHLAIMSDFQLDIDYPYEIVKKEELEIRPEKIPYSAGPIRYRHYGRYLQDMVKRIRTYEDPMQRQVLIRMLANQMKKSFNQWNKEGVDDQKILDDLCEYSGGTIRLTADDLSLLDVRQAPTGNGNNNNNNNNNRQRNNNNNNRRNNNNNGRNNNGRKKY
jgi:hypothetical protein